MSKKLNIIEAMKMPIGTLFNIDIDTQGESDFIEILKGDDEDKILCWNGKRSLQVNICTSTCEMKLTPIQQPVSFIEAVAKAKTNRFRIEHELLSGQRLGHTLRGTFDMLINGFCLSNDEIVDIILNSKCYIESEADSND